MRFTELYKRIMPVLRNIARARNGHGTWIDEDDLFQEMCIYAWKEYGSGVPEGINESYIIQGCRYHLMNYIRTSRRKTVMASLEESVDEHGTLLKDMIPERTRSAEEAAQISEFVDTVMRGAFTRREKEVFNLLRKGYTVREAGNILHISHVMVLKIRRGLTLKLLKFTG